ncbi:hypothetical protein, partial [Pseudomonas fluorescens]|uniref:hypothetical protein n=1 Tax=Pseudomonas fluorescens TaxID=294 RepID=UPI002B1DB000
MEFEPLPPECHKRTGHDIASMTIFVRICVPKRTTTEPWIASIGRRQAIPSSDDVRDQVILHHADLVAQPQLALL